MTYVAGAAAGLAFGALIAFLKYVFIWRKYTEKDETSGDYSAQASQIYIRSMVSYAVNIGALVLVFILRDRLPFDGIACLIGTAVSLGVLNRVFALRQGKNTAGR